MDWLNGYKVVNFEPLEAWRFSLVVVFKLQLLATAIMTGVIWFVQIVQYPMFDHIGDNEFANYHKIYCERIGWIVGPCMACELVTSLICWWIDPLGVHRFGLVMLALIWTSTAAIQIPIHNRLAKGHDPVWIRRLVASNWIRTVAWTIRLLMLLSVVRLR